MGFLDFHYYAGEALAQNYDPGPWKNYELNTVSHPISSTKGHLNSTNNTGQVNDIKMTPGISIANNTLSNPLTVAGTHCRGWQTTYDDPHNRDPSSSHKMWLGVGIVATGSLSGDLTDGHYPINDTPANGHLIAHSVRGFVRIDGVSGQGSCVGLVARHPFSEWDYRFPSESSVTGPYDGGSGGKFTTTHGYACVLTSCTVWKYQGTASSVGEKHKQYPLTAPQLLFYVDNNDRTEYTYVDNYVVNCGGTFAYNTWYHIRMDVEPAVSGDTIKVYTAPASDAIGSETWTLLQTISIAATDQYYIPPKSSGWPNENSVGAGYIAGNVFRVPQSTSAHQKMYLDGFQFLTQDLSS